MFGMRPVYEKRAGPDAQTMLRFGNDTLVLMNSRRADRSPYIDHFAFEIENYVAGRVEAELRRRGYKPQVESKLAWTLPAPEGMRIEIAGKGWPEYVGKYCNGSPAECPRG
ncbi:MAG: hypothetical protein ACXWC0_17465 [Burkholderiales bacterium]